MSVVQLPGGRQLSTLAVGAEAGPVVFHFHGTPSSRLEAEVFRAAAEELGVRLIAVDRPAYGQSTPHAGRSLRSWVDDVLALADVLRIDQFAVHGVSGGSPYALACGAFGADRVTRVGWSSGIVGPDWPMSEQLPVPFRDLLARAADDPDGFAQHLRDLYAGRLPSSGGEPASADVELLARRPDVARSLAAAGAEALAQGDVTAPLGDFVLYAGNWGFTPADVKTPVLVTMGDAEQPNAAELARQLADALPDSTLHLVPGGHLVTAELTGPLLQWLTGG